MMNSNPDDEMLIAYLFGEADQTDRQSIENWLGRDPAHGERLCQWAETIGDLATIYRAEQPSQPTFKRSDAHALVRRYRFVAITSFSLAASVLAIALFPRIAIENEDSRIALAWVDVRASDTDTQSPQLDWDGSMTESFASTTAEVDEVMEEMEGDKSTSEPISDEPPEWMLMAMSLMIPTDEAFDIDEVTP